MTAILKQFEEMALQVPSVVTIAGGVVFVGVGLCLWLGGLRWRIFTAVVMGLTAGLISSLFVSENKLIAAIFLTVFVGCSVLIFRKRSLVLIGAVTVTSILLVSLASPLPENSSSRSDVDATSRSQGKVDINSIISQLGSQSDVMGLRISTIIGELTAKEIGVAAASGSLVMVMGLFFYRFVSAGTCSIYGTGLIYAGMILLLLEKASMPVDSICLKPVFYQTVAICMVMFGTFVGLLVCPVKKKKNVDVKNDVGEVK